MRVINSPVEHFAGTVTLPDFLNILQLRKFQDGFFGDPNEVREEGKKAFLSVSDQRVLPAVLDIVLEWKLNNVPDKPTMESFPMTPYDKAHELLMWLVMEIYRIYTGEMEIPNA